jgi:hypothetical protein
MEAKKKPFLKIKRKNCNIMTFLNGFRGVVIFSPVPQFELDSTGIQAMIFFGTS